MYLFRSPGDPPPENPMGDAFLAFGRVFSGTARKGRQVHILSALYDPTSSNPSEQSAALGQLYLMMGRGLEKLEVSSGYCKPPQ